VKNFSCVTDKTLLQNCSLLKTILMLFVILGHSCLFWGGNWASPMKPFFLCPTLGLFANWLTSFHIYAFVVVSGYIFYYVKYERKNEKYHNLKKYIYTKFLRLYVPYIAVFVLWVVPLSLYVGVFHSSFDLLVNFLLGKVSCQLWFLLMLFGVFMISYLFADLWKKNSLLGLFIVFMFYGIGVCGAKFSLNYFQFFSSCSFLIFFFIGFKFRQNVILVHNLMRIPLLLWILIDVLLFAASLYGISIFPHIFIKFFIPLLLHIWGAVAAFIILQKIIINAPIIGKLFLPISKYTMPIYLLHQQIIYIVIYYLNGRLNPFLNSIANFFVSLIASLLISFFLMNFKITRFLIGEK